jgi:hypothetical protein
MTAAWGAVGLWAALAFVRSEAVRGWIFYASAFLVSVIVVSSLKIWFWLELNRYAHTRELKRLESQVALLVQTLNQRPRS